MTDNHNAPTPERKCCFKLRREIGDDNEKWREGCQFKSETKFFDVDGKFYCRFHMPLVDRFGKPTVKNGWFQDDKCLDAFKREVEQQLNPHVLYREGMRADLCGVVFPPDFKLAQSLPIMQRAPNNEPTKKHQFPILLAEGARFFGDTDLSNANFPAATSFKGAEFNGKANFKGSNFGSGCDFTNAVFRIAPDFLDAGLHQSCTIGKANFEDWKTAGAEDAYRVLKLAMETMRNWNGMAKFHALEERSARHQRKLFDPIRIASAVYDWASEYGQSFTRPLIGLLVIPPVWFLLYWGVMWAAGVTWDAAFLVEIFKFDLMWVVRLLEHFMQTVPPFKAFVQKEPDDDPILSLLAGGWYGVVITLAFLQTLATAGFVTLFILAVRRRFRMA